MRRVWFGPKRYGIGWSPTTAQGWAATGAYVVLMCAGATGLARVPGPATALLVLSTFGFAAVLVVTADRRPLRWRWGEDA